jgi:hypothetical protein
MLSTDEGSLYILSEVQVPQAWVLSVGILFQGQRWHRLSGEPQGRDIDPLQSSILGPLFLDSGCKRVGCSGEGVPFFWELAAVAPLETPARRCGFPDGFLVSVRRSTTLISASQDCGLPSDIRRHSFASRR